MASKSTLQSAQSLSKWIQLKIYQVEVTFSVYIFTPLEKFIFCTFTLTVTARPSHALPLFFSPGNTGGRRRHSQPRKQQKKISC